MAATSDAQFKFVDFHVYCKKCKHRDKDEKLDPCNECLEVGMREGTAKPEFFEEK